MKMIDGIGGHKTKVEERGKSIVKIAIFLDLHIKVLKEDDKNYSEL